MAINIPSQILFFWCITLFFSLDIEAHEIVRGSRCWGESSYFFLRQGKIDQERFPNDAPPKGALIDIFLTSDGIRLGGLLMAPNKSKKKTKTGFILIAQGNAMRVDDIYYKFLPLLLANLDIYIYDYRGYGRSEGNASFSDQAMDFVEIFDYLNQKYKESFVYGISHGAVVAINALHDRSDMYDALILDSMPSEVPKSLCFLGEYSPINFVTDLYSPLLLVPGKQDLEVPIREQEDFIEAVMKSKKSKACLYYDENLYHPLSPAGEANDINRFKKIIIFINNVRGKKTLCNFGE